MGQSVIKNPRKIFSLSGGDPSHENRITILENNEYKITYFAEISNSTGTITIPTGATILLDQLQGGVDAYVCTIQNGQPTGNFPQTGGGVTVDVTSFDALGAYTLSGTPSSYPVALIYILKIKAKDYSNLDITKILDLEDIGIISQTITNGVTTSAPSEDAVFDFVNANTIATVNVGWTTNMSPSDSTLYYLGTITNRALGTNGSIASARFRAPKTGTAYLFVFGGNNGVVSSNENNTLSLHNITQGTSVTISNTWQVTGSWNDLFSGFTLAVNSGDVLQIQWLTPAWATNPANISGSGTLYIK